MSWRILLSVPYCDMDEWRKINRIADDVDPTEDGAGSGFGSRDIDWTKETGEEATQLSEKLNAAFTKAGFDPTIEVYEDED